VRLCMCRALPLGCIMGEAHTPLCEFCYAVTMVVEAVVVSCYIE
jgi:hypothetical protein